MVEYQSELHGFFKEFLPTEDVTRLFQVLEPLSLKDSDVLFDSGDKADGIYFVVSGQVAVQKETGFGARKQVVALLDKCAPVGEGGLLSGALRGATVVAVRDCIFLHLSRNSFEQLCEERAEFGLNFFRWLLKRVSLRLERSTERLAHIL